MKKANEPVKAPEKKEPQTIGRKITYVLTVVLLVFLVIAFIGLPTAGGIAAGDRLVFGSYAGREITYLAGNYFAREYQRLAESVQQQQQQVTDLLVRQIWQTAFQRTLFHFAMLDLADQAGFGVTEDAVTRALARWPEFQMDGRFSVARYDAMAGPERETLRDYLRDSLIDQQVRADLFGWTEVSAAEREFITGLAGPLRQFRFLQLGYDDYPESEVVAYGVGNADRFRRINLSVITVTSNQAEAGRIREQAVGRQASFEDLARAHSADFYAESGGEMGLTYAHEIEPDFEDLSIIDRIFELPAGEISPVYRTTFGWAIYRVNEPTIDPDFTDPLVTGEVRDYLTVFGRGQIEDYLRDRASALARTARESGFAAAAAEIDQAPQLTGSFPVNYGNVPYFGTVSAAANQAFEAIAFREDVLTALFRLEPGQVTEPIVVRDYVFLVELAVRSDAEPGTVEFLREYLPFIVQEFTVGQLQEILIDEQRLRDNFNTAFNRLFNN